MAMQTLEEIEYAEDIKNKVQTVRRLIKAHQDDASTIMTRITELRNAVQDAPSKQAVVDIGTAWRAELASRTSV